MSAKTTLEDVILLPQAAEIAGLSVRSIRRYAESGKLPGVQSGGDGPWIFRRADVERFAKQPRRGPGYPKGRKRPERAKPAE